MSFMFFHFPKHYCNYKNTLFNKKYTYFKVAQMWKQSYNIITLFPLSKTVFVALVQFIKQFCQSLNEESSLK